MKTMTATLFAFVVLSTGLAHGAEFSTVLLSFRRNLTAEQAKAVLADNGLDAGDWTVMRWAGAVRQMVYRGRAPAGLKERAERALEEDDVVVTEVRYMPGQVSVTFEQNTTRDDAAALLKRLELDRDVQWHETRRTLRATIRGLDHGREWRTIETLRPQDIVHHAALLFFVENPS